MGLLQWKLTVIFIILANSLLQIYSRPYILFANRRDIRLMELLDYKRKAPTNIIVKNLEDAAALDFFLDFNQVCWSEINREVIRCAKIDPGSRGKVTKTDVVSTGLIKPEGLACDWVNNKIYWTDSDTKRIEVAGLSGLDSDRTVLLWEDLDLPRPIAVDPLSGFMFWSDWGDYPKIEKCGMNGDPKTRQIIVDSDLIWPNGLTLDYAEKRVYWVEAQLSYIASVDFDGRNRRTVFVGDKSDLPQPFAISVFNSVLYWTDWDTKSLNLYNQTDDSKGKIKIKGKIDPMDVKVFDPGRQPPSTSPCQERNGGCSHICLAAPAPDRFSCRCPTGFKMLNSTTCADRNSEILLLAARHHIIKVSLDTPDYTDIVIPLDTVLNSIAIDFDPITETVFWTDLADDKMPSIRSAKLDGSEEAGVVVSDVDHPDGLAVDWIVGNIVWTDSGTDRIEIVRLDGSNRRVIISEDLDEPRSIVVDSINGWIFWSDWGKIPRIERAWMDGRNREIVINSELVWPNGIALDVPRKKLYWCDAQLDRIEVSNWDGSERTILIDRDIPHPFGFTLMGNQIYWTDWQLRSIHVANKYTGLNRSVLVSHLDELMGLKAVSTHPDIRNTPHPCHTLHCSHLCLMTPGDGALCSCPNGYELTADNKTCIIPEAFLLYTRRDDVRRISMETPNTNILLPVKNVEEASALNFDQRSGLIYWSDVRSKTISRSYLNGSSQQTIVEFGLDFPESLAVDWLAGNLYWLDAGIGRLEISRLDGSQRRVLLWQDVDNLKSLAIDEVRGYMYWSTWGQEPLIHQALLDGTQRKIFVEGEGRAGSLALDHKLNRLYWTDRDMNQIKYIDIETEYITVLVDVGEPTCIALYKDKLFWTDWQLQTVSKLSLQEPKLSRTIIHTNIDYVMDLLAFHENKDKNIKDKSECVSNKCSGVCVVKPEKEKIKRPTCLCPTHYQLGDDGYSCTGPRSFILYSQRNKISRLVMDPGHPEQVPDIMLPIKRAKSIQGMDYNLMDKNIYWIDQGKRGEQPLRQSLRRSLDTGETDRLDVFDKVAGGSQHLLPFDIIIDPYTQLLYWSCLQTNSINVTRLYGNDSIPLGPLYVGGGKNLPRYLALNPVNQVLYVYMSGELAGEARIVMMNLRISEQTQLVNNSLGDVTSLTMDSSTNTLYWADRSLKKIEMININTKKRVELINEGIVEPVGIALQDNWLYWADRDQNSIVRVDKLTGTSRQTVVSRVARLSSLVAINYIPPAKLLSHPCNNPEVHGCSHFCALGSERQVVCTCPSNMALLEDGSTCGSPSCKKNEFTCSGAGPTGQGPMCIPLSWRCDGQPECGDRSDELNCPECGPSKFQCKLGQCIPSIKVCDSVFDCDDHSDETNCCAQSEFQCAVTKKCIDRAKLCNGEPDCGDSSDELPPECEQPNGLISGHIGGAGNESATAATSTYLIAIFAALISLFMLSILVYYCKRRTAGLMSSNSQEDRDAIRPLATACSRPSGDIASELASQPQAGHMGTLGSERHGGVNINRNGGSGIVVNHDAGSSNGLMYDRSHVTGASSTADTSSSGNYPVGGGHGPPPSPVTSLESRMSKLSQFRLKGPRNGKRPPSTNGFNAGLPTGYTFASTGPRGRSGAAPPCTPCSTDINDESDSVAYSSMYPPMQGNMGGGGLPHFPSRAGSIAPSRTGYESETYCIEEEIQQTTSYMVQEDELPSLQERGRYAPPPSTPLYLSDYRDPDMSGPPSPTTERSFFLNPCIPGPPPSPVPSPTREGHHRFSEEECVSD